VNRHRTLVVGLLLAVVLGGVAPAVAVGERPAVSDPGLIVVDTSLAPERPVPDENFTLTTTVRSADLAAERYVVREIAVREGPSRTSDGYNATDPDEWIAPGGELDRNLSVELDETGTYTLYLHLRLVTETGESTSVVEPITVEVHRPHPQVGVEAASALPGTDASLNVTVANGMDVPVQSLRLRACGDARVENPTRVFSSLPAGAEQSVTYTIPNATVGTRTVCLALAYRTENGTHRSVRRHYDVAVRPPENPGEVTLTGLSATRENGTLVVSGSAGNVGGSEVTGVVVRAAEGEGVVPANGGASYFVGAVPASDFTSFEVRARLTGDADTVTVPVRVSYSVDGVRRTTVATVRYDPPDRTQSPDDNGGLPFQLLGGGAAALVVGLVGWRRFDGR
jgi:hypothetical protein